MRREGVMKSTLPHWKLFDYVPNTAEPITCHFDNKQAR